MMVVLLLLLQNIMILGDFNADGRYLSKKKKEKIRICSAAYHWLIGDDVDTTASNCNDHTYDRWDASQRRRLSCSMTWLFFLINWEASSADRIVVYGQTALEAVVPGSAKSFNFQREFSLTDEQVRLVLIGLRPLHHWQFAVFKLFFAFQGSQYQWPLPCGGGAEVIVPQRTSAEDRYLFFSWHRWHILCLILTPIHSVLSITIIYVKTIWMCQIDYFLHCLVEEVLTSFS